MRPQILCSLKSSQRTTSHRYNPQCGAVSEGQMHYIKYSSTDGLLKVSPYKQIGNSSAEESQTHKIASQCMHNSYE